mmetsp:Transcript_77400/g.239698  ORF Transcript_77400/g.239698 Transcript_77400/m.239698 type:complete len:204 (-) Transcript_77400:155-766(-)
MRKKCVPVGQEPLPGEVLEIPPAVEHLHKVEDAGPPGPGPCTVPGQEHLLPALPLRAARPRPLARPFPLAINDVGRGHAPRAHAEVPHEAEGQLRAFTRLAQQDLGVVAGRPGHGVIPAGELALRAHAVPGVGQARAHRRVPGAPRQGVVEHAHDGRERLVPHGEVRIVVAALILEVGGHLVVPHPLDLVPDGCAEQALAAGH